MTQPPSGHRAGTTGGPSPALKQVFQSEHFTILVDERMGIVRSVRSDKPFASIQELEAAFGGVINILDGLGRERYALLSDVRAAPGRNDPSFEAALRRIRPRMLSGFRKVGMLVQSVAGMLQGHRYAREDGIKRLVTNDEDELLKYLTQKD